MQTFQLQRNGTDEQAADSVTTALGHVAFMAWLVEIRDQRDAQIMKQILIHRHMSNSTHELCTAGGELLGKWNRFTS